MSWLAPLTARLAFLVHRACGHAVSWRSLVLGRERGDCPGDIVCHDCRQVLWCRAHDPWRPRLASAVADHWSAPPARLAQFEALQRILSLADACPRGRGGDQVRQLASEMIEAVTSRQRASCRRRMLTCLAHLELSRTRGRSGDTDPSEIAVQQLAVALTALRS